MTAAIAEILDSAQALRRALALAQQALGRTRPNPHVGAVLRDPQGRVLGEGFHARAGTAHAEVAAIQAAGAAAHGAHLSVTLEPCTHHGRTPPCTDAILQAGITSVTALLADPNPKATGGLAALAAAGIETRLWDEPEELRAGLMLNRGFFHHLATGLPRVVAKLAMSLDGRVATQTGESRWITGPMARAAGHHLRQEADAILIGAGTLIADDPALTARLPDGSLRPAQPLRILADSAGRSPLTARMLSDGGGCLVATTAAAPAAWCRSLEAQGVEVLVLPAGADGRLSLPDLLQALGRRGHQLLLVEGGPTLLGALHDLDLIDEVAAFLSPRLLGGAGALPALLGTGRARLDQAPLLTGLFVQQLEPDWLLQGHVRPIPHPAWDEAFADA